MIRKSVQRYFLATNAKRVCAEIMFIAEVANGVLHDDAEFGIRTPAAKEAAFRSPLSLPTKGVVAFGHYWKADPCGYQRRGQFGSGRSSQPPLARQPLQAIQSCSGA